MSNGTRTIIETNTKCKKAENAVYVNEKPTNQSQTSRVLDMEINVKFGNSPFGKLEYKWQKQQMSTTVIAIFATINQG